MADSASASNSSRLPEVSTSVEPGSDIRSSHTYDRFTGTSSSESVSSAGVKSRLEYKFDNLQDDSSELLEKTELEKYLDEALFPKVDDPRSFDILSWWKLKSPTYPILATMARDNLAVPVSTVASESAFSCSGRLVTEQRSSLAPDIVEALSCVKDWLPRLPKMLLPWWMDQRFLMLSLSTRWFWVMFEVVCC